MKERSNKGFLNLGAYKTEIIRYTIATISVLLIGSIFIILSGENPLIAFSAIIRGSLFGRPSIARTLRWVTPSLIAGTAAVISNRAGIFNLGVEGQIYIGAFVAAVVGYAIPASRLIHLPLAILSAGVGGALFAFIPALLKRYYNINEMTTTLMFNYVAILLTEYLTMQLMGVTGTTSPDYVATPAMLPTARLSPIMPPYQASTGFFIGLALIAGIYFLFSHTKKGYELKQVGENINFARYGGINVFSTYFYVFLASGFIAGVGGAVEIMGAHGRFRAQFSNNLGWDGIMIALIAKDNPIGLLVVALLWGIVKNGSFAMERTTNVNRLVVTLIQALFVLFVTADFDKVINRIRARFQNKEKMEAEEAQSC